ncbi:UNVERIFIED_CONTAM: hypothetical protein K2H54_058505 [Gekko kuhli]
MLYGKLRSWAEENNILGNEQRNRLITDMACSDSVVMMAASTIVMVAASTVIINLWLLVDGMMNTKFSLEEECQVTGGSSGIGKSIAVECFKQGAFITLLARNEMLAGSRVLSGRLCASWSRVPHGVVQIVILDTDLGSSTDKGIRFVGTAFRSRSVPTVQSVVVGRPSLSNSDDSIRYLQPSAFRPSQTQGLYGPCLSGPRDRSLGHRDREDIHVPAHPRQRSSHTPKLAPSVALGVTPFLDPIPTEPLDPLIYMPDDLSKHVSSSSNSSNHDSDTLIRAMRTRYQSLPIPIWDNPAPFTIQWAEILFTAAGLYV